ncbi:ribosomal-processing cysteine protease Prp [Novibacillus thermophilus]|jgi:uncharacterized protein YsxB (DUF464 family)|uniref:Ribosomal processing cysteine protease Prp n=1 Tax=Novibacillus thermophilus TaxID=1471761 RepID=A0A1U9K589_9BACL|nr:ribosomal-processing cysteine protease Prp [Novibacillus thermophilus]AQS55194.1 hypothetical protein B0W44_04805 [Novibacillus thermophilus]
MVTVQVTRDTIGQWIRQVSISGHALYDDYGKDIVCAAVSSVSINILNAIETLLDVSLEMEEGEDSIVARVPDMEEPNRAEHVQLLMETLVYSLNAIAKEYPSFVSVRES